MRLGPFTLLTANYWVDLQLAAEYTGVPLDVLVDAITDRELRVDLRLAAEYTGVKLDVLVDAITSREVRATATHPERYGDWMVPLADLDQWLGRRARARVTA
jgi:hypothetical protein